MKRIKDISKDSYKWPYRAGPRMVCSRSVKSKKINENCSELVAYQLIVLQESSTNFYTGGKGREETNRVKLSFW